MTADPWALLREARESVFRDSLCREYDDSHKAAAMEEHRRRTRLLDRIDAALAERADSAKDVVESEPVEWQDSERRFGWCDETETSVRIEHIFDAQRWSWEVSGLALTEAEAKSAAIAAARGMR
jgi:hypothetical protein